MSTNHTPNYALSLWEASDQVLRTEFNENHAKIDAALACHPSAELIADSAVDADSVNRVLMNLDQINWSRYMALALIVDTSLDDGFQISMGVDAKSIHLYSNGTGGMGHRDFTFSFDATNLTLFVPVFYDGSHAAMALSFGSTTDSSAFGSLTGGGSPRPLNQCLYLSVARYNGVPFSPGDRAVLWGIK